MKINEKLCRAKVSKMKSYSSVLLLNFSIETNSNLYGIHVHVNFSTLGSCVYKMKFIHVQIYSGE